MESSLHTECAVHDQKTVEFNSVSETFLTETFFYSAFSGVLFKRVYYQTISNCIGAIVHYATQNQHFQVMVLFKYFPTCNFKLDFLEEKKLSNRVIPKVTKYRDYAIST